MDLEFTGQAALVTGAGRGIGAAIARAFAREGCRVALVDLNAFDDAERIAATLRASGVRAIALRADVTDLTTAAQTVDAAVRELGRLDHLVCNAGIARDSVIWKMSDAAWNDVIAVNLTGCFAYCRAVAPLFRQQQHGKIVTIASINALRGKMGLTNYAASKAGIIALTRTLARELGNKGVNVNCVAPGFVRTEMTAALPKDIVDKAIAETALGRLAEPDDVARVVTFLCSEDARHITGEIIRVDGGQCA